MTCGHSYSYQVSTSIDTHIEDLTQKYMMYSIYRVSRAVDSVNMVNKSLAYGIQYQYE